MIITSIETLSTFFQGPVGPGLPPHPRDQFYGVGLLWEFVGNTRPLITRHSPTFTWVTTIINLL